METYWKMDETIFSDEDYDTGFVQEYQNVQAKMILRDKTFLQKFKFFVIDCGYVDRLKEHSHLLLEYCCIKKDYNYIKSKVDPKLQLNRYVTFKRSYLMKKFEDSETYFLIEMLKILFEFQHCAWFDFGMLTEITTYDNIAVLHFNTESG